MREFSFKKIVETQTLFFQQKVIRGSIWVLFGTFIPILLSSFSSVFIARILGKNSFGEYGILQTTLNMLAILATFGMGTTATKYISSNLVNNKKDVGHLIGLLELFGIIIGTLFLLIFISLAPFFSLKIFGDKNHTELLRILSFLILPTSVLGIQSGILAGFEAFKKLSFRNMICGTISVLLSVLGAFFYKLNGLVTGLLIAALFNCIVNFYAIKMEFKQRGIENRYSKNMFKNLNMLWDFSLPSFLCNVLAICTVWIGNLILVKNAGFEQMAAVTVSNQWKNVILFLPGILAQAFLPAMSQHLSAEKSLQNIKQFFKINLMITTPLIILFSFSSGPILSLYGSTYKQFLWIFLLFQFAGYLQALQIPLVTFWVSNGKMWSNFFMNLVWAGSLIAFFYTYGFNKGAFSLALANIFSFSLFGILIIVYLFYSFRTQLRGLQ